MEKEQLLLVDGNSLINRAFYALPQLTNKEGVQCNAVFGVSNMLIKLIMEHKFKYIAFAFDRHAPTFRHEMFKDYKATRSPTPPELRSQFPLLKELLKAMGIKCFEFDGDEADDIIGSFTKKFNTKNIVLSADKDLLQLINENTQVWLTKKGASEIEIMTEETLQEKMGVKPFQIVELKSLMGDSSDNIPGVYGIGEKTAVSLLQKYESLDGVYSHINEISGKTQEKLLMGKESAYMSHALATINTNVKLDVDLESLQIKMPFSHEVYEFFVKYDFRILMKKTELFEDKPLDAAKSIQKIEIYELDDAKNLANELNLGNILAFQIEGEELHLSNSKYQEYVVKAKSDLPLLKTDISEYIKCFKSVFENENIVKVCQDVKHSKKQLSEYDIKLNGQYFDILIAKHLVYGSIKTVLNNNDLFGDFSYPTYAIAACLLSAKADYENKINEQNLNKVFYDIEIPLINVLYDMEKEGFKIDVNSLNELNAMYTKEIDELTNKIYELAGETFNVNSPKQLSSILFDKLNISTANNKKKNTGAEILEKIKDEHPIIPCILRYRKIFKLNNTYVEALLNLGQNNRDNIIHTVFHQTITATGRLSSTEPNLQNIPIREEEGRFLRKAFIPRNPNGSIMSADYSQIELRLVTHFSEDKNLQNAYQNNIDIHTKTASDIFGVPLQEVNSNLRRMAKAVNFGIIYGISEHGLSENLGISKKEAKTFIEKYFMTYPKIGSLMDDNVKVAREKGYAQSLYNRRRRIDELNSSNYMIRTFGERAAMNMPLQSTASDIIKIAMIKVFYALKENNLKSKLILQIHDELIVDVFPGEEEKVKEILKSNMENGFSLNVPLVVQIEYGKNWYDAK